LISADNMPQWNFVITPEAEADLNKLDAVVRKRILARLKWFVDNLPSKSYNSAEEVIMTLDLEE